MKTHPTTEKTTIRIPHITHHSTVTFCTFHSGPFRISPCTLRNSAFYSLPKIASAAENGCGSRVNVRVSRARITTHHVWCKIINKCSAVAEMGDRGHNRHGPKRWGAAVLLSRRAGSLGPRLIQCGLGRGLLPYQVASSSIQSFGHNRHGPKIGWGGCALFWG